MKRKQEIIDVTFWGRIKLFFSDWWHYSLTTALYNQEWISKHK